MYEFPNNWREKENPAERKEALQIPENILHEIPTTQLLDICVVYPYLIDILFFSNFQDGFEKLVDEFNGLKELLHRNDAKYVVLNKYISMVANPTFFNDYTSSQKGGYSFKLFFIEILLSQREILSEFNNSDTKAVLIKSYNMLQEKHDNRQVYGEFGKTSSFLLMARLIHKEKYIAQDHKSMDKPTRDFIEKPVVAGNAVKHAVIEDVKTYITTINQ
jgi:hypothetical protein